MGRRSICGGWAALSAAAICSPAFAQAYGGSGDGLVQTRHISIGAQVATTYDDNVPRGSEQLAAERHLSMSDEIIQPAATIDIYVPISREAVFLVGTAGYDFYAHNSVLNRERIDLTGGGSAQFARCKGTLTGVYQRHVTQIDEILPGNTGVSAVSNVTTRTEVAFSASCPRPIGFSPNLSVSRGSYDNSAHSYQTANSNSFSAQGGLSYSRPTIGSIQMFGSYSATDYPNPFFVPLPSPPYPPGAVLQLKNSYKMYGAGLTYFRPIGSRISGSVSASYSDLEPDQKFNPGFSGLTFNAELSYRPTSRLIGHVMASRATQPSNQVGAAYSIGDTLQLDASYLMGSRIKFNVGGYHDMRSYRGGALHTNPLFLTESRANRVFGSASFTLNKHFSAQLDASNEKRSANVALYRYNDNRVGLTLKAAF